MKKEGQKFFQTFLNEIRFRIKLKHSEWKTQARISYIFAKFPQRIRFRSKLKHSEWKTQARISYIFAKFPQRNSILNQFETFWMKNACQNFLYLCKISSTNFDLESNCNFLNEKGRPEIPSDFPQRNSIQDQIETFWMKNAGQNFLYLCKMSSTKFDLESNWNILNKNHRPEFPISLQNLLNEVRFRIKLQFSGWKTQARSSYIFAKVP